MELIKKEEIASQVLAVIKSTMTRWSSEDILDILDRAAGRVTGAAIQPTSETIQPQI